VFLGWGPLGALATLVLGHHFGPDLRYGQGALVRFAIGYVALSIIGLFAESIYAWIKRRSNEQRGKNPRTDRTDCHLVHITVDSYAFDDKVGKDFDPATGFAGKPALWGAVVVPDSFVFLPGEAYRDVDLRVDAPDGPGPAGRFNVNVRQGGVPSGGVTIDITRGG
jgi:hypothetical protein